MPIDVDEEPGRRGATFVAADGTSGDMPAVFVLYYCDPTCDWSPVNQFKLAELAGYRVTFTLKQKPAA